MIDSFVANEIGKNGIIVRIEIAEPYLYECDFFCNFVCSKVSLLTTIDALYY